MGPLVYERVAQRVKAAFDYAVHKAWDWRRTQGDLRRAVELFERKERDSVLANLWGESPAGRLPKKEIKSQPPGAIFAEFFTMVNKFT